MFLTRRPLNPLVFVAFGSLALAPPLVRAQQDPTVESAVQYLRRIHNGRQIGETAMIALGLLKADVPSTDPAVTACLSKIRSRFVSQGYDPERKGGHDVYEAAVVAMAVANMDAPERGNMLETLAAYLRMKQKPNGSWDYEYRQNGDTSISQYAVLGLWECENNGVAVSPSVWDRAAQWYISNQRPNGGWTYHPDSGGSDTVSMTAAGVGSLLICRLQLESYRSFQQNANPYLTPIEDAGAAANFKPSTPRAQLDAAIARGMNWLSTHFNTADTVIFGHSMYYGLYGIERIGALSKHDSIGRVDWFQRGGAYIRSNQRTDGSWSSGPYNDDVNTVWAMLFLTRSTRKSIEKREIRKLGSGTLLGGRYLPSDLTTLTVAGGRVINRPMNGAVESMLDILEDPRILDAETALAGVLERYQQQGADALRPYKDRFRRMLSSSDPGLREVGAWALGRTGDLDSAPDLIQALEDEDERVVTSARQGLQLLSRKIDGPGPGLEASPEQKKAAAREWRRWYESVRPLDASAPPDDSAVDRRAEEVSP